MEAAADGDAPRKPNMDYLGTLTMTAAIVLLVYGMTSANVDGWSASVPRASSPPGSCADAAPSDRKSASAISTTVIGFLLFFVFYWVETLPENEDDALIPPSMWQLHPPRGPQSHALVLGE